MESEENDSRTVLFGAIDENIVRMRDQIKLVLGKQRSKVYFSYLKEWLRGHKSQQEFDVLGLAMMPNDQKFVHSDFLLTMANTCNLHYVDGNSSRTGDGATKRHKDWTEQSAEPSTLQPTKKSRLLAEIEYVLEKNTTVVPAIPAEHCTMLEGLSEVPPLSGWLPSKGQVLRAYLFFRASFSSYADPIKGRMLLAAWEHGIEDVAEDAINPIMAATRVIITNLLEEAIKIKRSYLTSGSGFAHTYGVQKNKNSTGMAEGYVIVPSNSSISTLDFVDISKMTDRVVSGNLIKNPSLHQRLIGRLYNLT
uniref:Transcriptional adapter 1 n=1 Tax=Ascaris lumbricoides TaxID=6252 RepID=A0A0M3HX83_ASCLU